MPNNADFSGAIAEIRSKTDIVGLISEYVALKKRGRNYWGCCPFHNEKTASFSVSAEKTMFYCFGCQSGGDAFAFLMKIENRPFIEAARLLGERVGVKLPEKTREDKLSDKQREAVKNANAMAVDFFHSCLLNTSYGKEALEYLANRGITETIIKQFKIGFAPQAPDKLCHALRQRLIDSDVLVKAGLALKTQRGTVLDSFRNRIMIPIIDLHNAVIAFGGRAMNDTQPKYLNTPDTELFSKKNCLYALNIAQTMARKEQKLLIVEGYFDAITLHVNGIENVVAGMGTALSARQAALAAKNAATIYLCYDNDEAGRNATLRAYELLKSTGAKVRVVDLLNSKDPDEFIRAYGKEEFNKQLNEARGILEYVIETVISGKTDDSLDSRVSALENILQFFGKYAQPLELEQQFATIASRLRLDEKLIREEFAKVRKVANKRRNVGDKVREIAFAQMPEINETERQLLRYFIERATVRATICQKSEKLHFSSEKIKDFWQALFNIYSANNSFTIVDAHSLSEINANYSLLLSKILLKDDNFGSEDPVLVVEQLMDRIYEQYLGEKLRQHIIHAGELEKSGSEEFQQELQIVAQISSEIQKIRKK
ncbi:MAG: DNA primase [Negativicutes bacterium]|jgi:DNA primase